MEVILEVMQNVIFASLSLSEANSYNKPARLAQYVKHKINNLRVVGSIPGRSDDWWRTLINDCV